MDSQTSQEKCICGFKKKKFNALMFRFVAINEQINIYFRKVYVIWRSID